MSKQSIKKNSIIAAMAAVSLFTFFYWLFNQFYSSTDDAYVNANIVQVAPRVTGQVAHLYVTDNQFVTAGQPLFELDPATFQTAVDQARAHLDMDLANLQLAQVTAKRTAELAHRKAASAQENDKAAASLQAAIASVQLSKSNLAQAELNLQYTKVIAPTTGWVTNVTLREGNVVSANQPLFALISNNEYWIDANFKETELTHIHSGQAATIKIDMYPGRKFKGIVESISGGSGTAFSLLPPENATGNWVKVTQRVPVRIRIINPNDKYPLRISTSARVSIRIDPWKA